MRMVSTPLAAALLACLFAAGTAQAQSWPSVKLSGFGTAAATHSSERNADFTSSSIQPDGAGMTNSWSYKPDTKLGVQADVAFTDKLFGVAQLVSEHRVDHDWGPQVEWLNLKYQATPDLALRAGRIAMPFFLYSDTRQVGYAQPWVRPPLEAYIVQPNTTSDGVDAMYRAQLGGFTHNLQAFYGRNNVNTFRGEAKAPVNWGVNDTAQYGDLTLRAAYTYSKVSIPSLEPFTAGLAAFGSIPGPVGAEAARLASTYHADDLDFHTLALAASYDPGRWFLTGEFIDFRGESYVQGTRAWYVSGGYRFGDFTPYATYAGTKNRTTQEAGIPFAPAAPLNAALNGILGSNTEQKTLSLGVRWDFVRNADLKVQYDRIKLGANSSGLLINPTANFQPGGNANVFTVAVDFIF